jgi:hypothetical protein
MSSVEACWTVRFGDPTAPAEELNGGIIVLESGRLFGGDSGYAYLGRYEVQGDQVVGALRSIRHHPGVNSMYGRDEDVLELDFRMQRSGDNLVLGELVRPGFPNGKVILRRLAELP